jgi:Transposase IS116/IS110/IS902 family
MTHGARNRTNTSRHNRWAAQPSQRGSTNGRSSASADVVRRRSGEAPARSGRISKRGSPSARWALVEAAWTAVNQPGPLHAFYQRTRAHRGHGKAIVATARKLAILFWCMLTRSQDYAHQQPSLTRKKLRRLEITAGAPKYTRRAAGVWATNDLMRTAELELARQAETSYKRMVQDQQAGAPVRKVGASATPERAYIRPSRGHSRAADSKLLTSALRYVSHPRPTHNLRLHTRAGKTSDSARLPKYRPTRADPHLAPPQRAHRRPI